MPSVRFKLQLATNGDAAGLAALHNEVAERLTSLHGRGAWSGQGTEKGALHGMRTARVFVAREGSEIVATLRLTTKKPWAIDTSYFTAGRTALYLLGMAVAPGRQRCGIGRRCMEEARRLAKAWPADAIRLDAFAGEAGAGGFYARCGYTEMGRATYRNTPLIYYEILLS
jgi:GNAT superfamily N-acetyltransferase